MATAVSSLARIRSAAVSARGFQTAAVVTLVLLWLVVTTGGLVRLTASGLGCPHWPTCEANHLVPSASYHAVIEFTNRVISGVAMLASVATAIMAYRVPGLKRGVCRAAALAAAGTVAQVPLGALTVAFDLHPLLVMTHFLVAIVATGLAAVLFARFSAGAATPPPRPQAWLARGSVLVAFGLIVSGAFSTAAGPHAGGEDIRRMGNLLDTTYVHVRVATTYIIVTAVLLLVLQFGPWRPERWRGLALGLIVLLPLQAAIGEYQWHNQLPWGVVLAHVSVAAAAWITCVCLATRIVGRRF